jgi:sorting nexin-4
MDLDCFQRQKVADLREMALSMARSHRDWCKKASTKESYLGRRRSLMTASISQNLEAWEDVNKEIQKIPDHPNRMPEPSDANANTMAKQPPNPRRDSSATINGH